MNKKKKGPKQGFKQKKLVSNLTRSLTQCLQGRRFKPSSFEKLVDLLQIDPNHIQTFKEIVGALTQDGKIQCDKGLYALPKTAPTLSGPIHIHHKKGFGFVKALSGPDIFIPRHATKDAVDGDVVEIEVNPNVSAKGPEGIVIAILERSRTHLACTVTIKKGPHYLGFSPLLGLEKKILISSPSPLEEGDRIICQVTDWEGEDATIEATLDRKLGHISDPSIDVKAAIEEFELPNEFSKEALAEAKKYGSKVSSKDVKERVDLTHFECVTIDPDTAKDFDDAISLTMDEKGHYLLGVHIADVAHYVKPGMVLDEEARTRCNSTYFPGAVVPMLPKELSNELCSLKPNVLRLAESVLAEFNAKGDLLRFEIQRTCIRSAKRFTYKEALDVLEGKKKSKHSPLLKRMVSLCHLLKKKRMERGSIDFSLPESVIIVDQNGVPSHIEQVEYDITHQMIEEFMLKANEIVATHLKDQGKKLIYRVHEIPTEESFKDFYAFARSLGFTLPKDPTREDLQKLFTEAKGSPSLPQLSVAFIRSMRLAAYSPDNIGHYGLALDYYCHFTSPIRRYTDLIIQRLLFHEIDPDADLQEVAQGCSEKERVSFKAESSVKILKKLRLANQFFKEDPSKSYEAVITKLKPFALFFEVPLLGLEGTFHVSEIGRDYYEYNPNRMCFKGKRSGKTFSAGDLLNVQLNQIDFLTRQVSWSLISNGSR